MLIETTSLPDVKILTPKKYEDDRGYFCETWNRRQLESAGIEVNFVQDNESFSKRSGTIRGLHYQAPPFSQAKLIRVSSGAILDVVVDARVGSHHYGKWVSVELSECNGRQIFVPRGFLHGFVTLEPNTRVTYKVDNFYDSHSDGAVKWNDPDLAIDWDIDARRVSLSAKDAMADSFSGWVSPFHYGDQ